MDGKPIDQDDSATWPQLRDRLDEVRKLAEAWEQERASRISLAAGMATEGNRGYQEGYADSLGGCVEALGLILDRPRETS